MSAETALLSRDRGEEHNRANLNYTTMIETPSTRNTASNAAEDPLHEQKQTEVRTSSSLRDHPQKRSSELDEAIESRFNSIFSEMDTNDALNIDINESEWLKCSCCGRTYKVSLTVATIIAAIIGAAIGILISLNTNLSSDWFEIIALPGELWLRALKLLVLPLLSLMMVVLPSRVDEVSSVSKACIPLYIMSSLCAALQGTVWGWTVRPGDHGKSIQDVEDGDSVMEPETDEQVLTELQAFIGIAKSVVPDNIIVAMAEMSVLGVILFFLSLGVLLKEIQNDEKVIILKFCRGTLKCIMKAIVYVIWLTPLGMMSLITSQIAYTQDLPRLLTSLGVFCLVFMVAVAVHVLLFYPCFYWLVTRNNICNAYRLLTRIYEAPLLAFATASSAATLPRSLLVAQKVGISKQVYQFVIPLGAAINMDGTALFDPIGIALIAQFHGVSLSIGTIAMVALLSVVVSVGAAPIPNAGLVYMLVLLRSAGLEEYEAEAIATLFVVGWWNDRLATAVNVISDQFVAKICDDIQLKAQKRNADIHCGCCVAKTRKRPSTLRVVKEQEMV